MYWVAAWCGAAALPIMYSISLKLAENNVSLAELNFEVPWQSTVKSHNLQTVVLKNPLVGNTVCIANSVHSALTRPSHLNFLQRFWHKYAKISYASVIR
jgi:hypothetical protein